MTTVTTIASIRLGEEREQLTLSCGHVIEQDNDGYSLHPSETECERCESLIRPGWRSADCQWSRHILCLVPAACACRCHNY